jgi:hypothetical protein
MAGGKADIRAGGKGGVARPAPGDEAPPGTPGTGENVCPECHGSGRIGRDPCPNCAGTGKIIEGIGGG